MVSGDLQFIHEPVMVQGRDSPNLFALRRAASFLARFIAESTSAAALFMPTIRISFLGPYA